MEGDIEIKEIGLAKGEKLYEELLIDAESEATAHELIYRAKEKSLAPKVLGPKLDTLEEMINKQDVNGALQLLSELVPEWQRGDIANANNIKASDTIKENA